MRKANKIKKRDLAYYIAYTLYIVINLLYTTSVQNLFGLIPLNIVSRFIMVLVFGIFGYLLIINIDRKHCLVAALILVCSIVVTFNTSSEILLSSMLFILTAKKIDIKKLAGYTFNLNTVFIVVIALLSCIGVLPIQADTRDGFARYALGFASFNTISIAIFRSVLLYCLVKYDSLKLRHYLGCLAVGIITYFLTRSRIAFYTTLIFLALLIYSKVRKKAFTSRRFLVASELILPLLTFVSIYFGSMYFIRHDSLQKLNILFSGRLYFINYYLANYGIKTWGQNISFISTRESVVNEVTWFSLDNSYANALVYFGIVLSVILFFMYSVLIYKAWKNSEKKITLYLISMLFVGLTENGIFLLTMNFVLLYFMQLLNLKNKSGPSQLC